MLSANATRKVLDQITGFLFINKPGSISLKDAASRITALKALSEDDLNAVVEQARNHRNITVEDKVTGVWLRYRDPRIVETCVNPGSTGNVPIYYKQHKSPEIAGMEQTKETLFEIALSGLKPRVKEVAQGIEQYMRLGGHSGTRAQLTEQLASIKRLSGGERKIAFDTVAQSGIVVVIPPTGDKRKGETLVHYKHAAKLTDAIDSPVTDTETPATPSVFTPLPIKEDLPMPATTNTAINQIPAAAPQDLKSMVNDLVAQMEAKVARSEAVSAELPALVQQFETTYNNLQTNLMAQLDDMDTLSKVLQRLHALTV